jgi:hypothetical protein
LSLVITPTTASTAAKLRHYQLFANYNQNSI